MVCFRKAPVISVSGRIGDTPLLAIPDHDGGKEFRGLCIQRFGKLQKGRERGLIFGCLKARDEKRTEPSAMR